MVSADPSVNRNRIVPSCKPASMTVIFHSHVHLGELLTFYFDHFQIEPPIIWRFATFLDDVLEIHAAE